MKSSAKNIVLKSVDDIFQTEENRADAQRERVQEIPLDQLKPFKNHPFKVRDDQRMLDTVDSIREYGVLVPAIARPDPEGGYELISGHRRKRGCEMAGLQTMPVIIRDLDDDAAVLVMVDSNIQREHISPMEKARAYAMRLDAAQRKRGRPSKENYSQVGNNFGTRTSSDELSEKVGESKNQIFRYVRLNCLVPDLQKKVDDGSLKFNPAVELSYLTPTEQNDFLDYIESQSCSPSLSQAQKLKAASKDGALDHGKLLEIMDTKKPSVPPRDPTLTISVSKIARYFPTGYTQEQMVGIIMQLLERNSRHLMPEKQPSLER